jgi:hypothetical protein
MRLSPNLFSRSRRRFSCLYIKMEKKFNTTRLSFHPTSLLLGMNFFLKNCCNILKYTYLLFIRSVFLFSRNQSDIQNSMSWPELHTTHSIPYKHTPQKYDLKRKKIKLKRKEKHKIANLVRSKKIHSCLPLRPGRSRKLLSNARQSPSART